MDTRPLPLGIDTQHFGGRPLPLVIRPTDASIDPFSWAAEHRSWIERNLWNHGAVLFRGFGIDTPASVDRFARSISTDFPEFHEESSPRSQVEGKVQTSTDYPAEYPIQFHNEFSYSHRWPKKIYFGCTVPSTTGGETPLADSRKVLERLSAATRDRFERDGILYRRNYLPGRGVSWETAFGTSDRAVVEQRCAESGISCEWPAEGCLTTRQKSPAIARHPETGDETWFNHAYFFNVRSLEPAELREYMLMQPEDQLSTNSYYGDGSPIEAEVIDELREAFEAERVEFPWEKGDVLLVDNMLCAHARQPFTGERKVLAVMAEEGRGR